MASKEILGGPSAFSSSTINILAPLSVHNKCAFTFISHSTWNSAPDPISRSLFQRQNIKISLWQKRRLLSDMRVAPKKKRRVASSEYYSDPSSASERRERDYLFTKKGAQLSAWMAGWAKQACLPLPAWLSHRRRVVTHFFTRSLMLSPWLAAKWSATLWMRDAARKTHSGGQTMARRSRSFPSKNTCSRFSERLFPSLARWKRRSDDASSTLDLFSFFRLSP